MFNFNLSTNSGSTYVVTKTTTFFRARLFEADTSPELAYITVEDLAQSTGVQDLAIGIGNDSDQICVGDLILFNPSSTTYVKHFIAKINESGQDDQTRNSFIAGYGNTTSAVNAVQFKMSSGNFDGTILLYGIV